jgi:hypothetical protein
MKKQIIRIYDKVKIVNPQRFIRCGYPLHLPDVISEIDKEFCENGGIEFCKKFGIGGFDLRFGMNPYNTIIEALAYSKMKSLKFGGNKRQIFTENLEDTEGRIFQVVYKRYVKTGEYVYPRGESPYLDEQKTHTILRIYQCKRPDNMPYLSESIVNGFESFEIEACNVEKIKD